MALTETTARFTQGNLFRHVTVMSVTSSLGIAAIFAVDLIDVLFISMLGQTELAAAAGYAGVVMFFASAMNIGLSIAAGALVARGLGNRNRRLAAEHAASTTVVALAFGALVPLVTLANIEFLLGLVGAEGQVAELAARYLWIILPTTALSGLSMVAVAVLRAHGDARDAMVPALLGAAVNGIADPILIFALGLGLDGAAIATVLARLATAVLALWLAQSRHRAFCWPDAKCLRRDLRDALVIALPAMLGAVATPVGAAIITREMARHGSDAVAGMAVINRLVPFVSAVILALSGALGPIFAQNFGAGRMDRVLGTFHEGLRFLTIYVLGVSALLFVLREPVADLFDASGKMRDLLYLFMGPLALAMIFNGAIFVANAAFNNLGHPGYSTLVNWGRHTLGTWPFAVGFGMIWGAEGVLVGQAVGGAIFSVLGLWLGLRVIKAPCRDPISAHYTCPDQRMQVVTNRSYR
ncbi:MATE family efflux transporter [Roseovarius autotrophicus]|uniref:MATE family efflux transporter n=1 Tax=Roseovarius autotrophicus TaxID=2824121 RepID=UPI0019F7B9BC|nr:MATE family efflux transporter [Roseovarius autotrophicus]MBE0452139.1 MATE family efflux transporter [Roseovarius sp.]